MALFLVVLSLLDIVLGQSPRLERGRMALVFPVMRVTVAIMGTLLVRRRVNARLSWYLAVDYYDFSPVVETLMGRFHTYAAWSLALVLAVSLLLAAETAYRIKTAATGRGAIQAGCRVCMALALAASVVYSLNTINKPLNIAGYIFVLAVCQNGYFYLPAAVRGALAPPSPGKGWARPPEQF